LPIALPQSYDAALAENFMAETSTVALSPETVLAEMTKNGVTDIVWLPDSETSLLTLRGVPRVF
jgi:hypothetical protein